MKARIKTKLSIAISTLALVSVGTILGCATSCSLFNSSEDSPPEVPQPQDHIIDRINNAIDTIKPIDEHISQSEFAAINASNVIDYINLPPNIDKNELVVKNFSSTSNTISFQLYADGRYSNIITLFFIIQNDPSTGGSTPTPDASQQQEIDKWKNAAIPLQTLSEQDINLLKQQDTAGPVLESICEKEGLLDIDKYVYDFSSVNVTANTVSFTVNVFGAEDESIEFDIPNISFQYKQKSDSVDNTKLTEAVNELNNINWSNIKYNDIVTKHLTFHDLSPKAIQEGYILKFINGFDERSFNTKYGCSINIDENQWMFNVLEQTLSFKISVTIGSQSLDTNPINIKYVTPQEQLGVLDKAPVDNAVKVSPSYKGILTIVDPSLKKTSTGLYNGYFDKYFNTASNEVNTRNKWFEMLYQLRFVIYQSFGDNMTSIDYGVSGNRAILKAKVKEDLTINQPYIQLMNDQSVKNSITLRAGDILTLSLASNDWDFRWQTTNTGDALTGGRINPYYLGKGPEKSAILTGPTVKSLGFNAGKWAFSIMNNSSTIASLGEFTFRNNFTFSLPYHIE